VPVLYNLATCQLQSGRTEEARTSIETLRTRSGNDLQSHQQADLVEAQILLSEAKSKEAGTILRTIAENTKDDDPIRGHALFLLATARFDRGLTREAAEAGLAAAAAYRSSLGDWHPVLARTLIRYP
jgi:Tetratricopeptide repeat